MPFQKQPKIQYHYHESLTEFQYALKSTVQFHTQDAHSLVVPRTASSLRHAQLCACFLEFTTTHTQRSLEAYINIHLWSKPGPPKSSWLVCVLIMVFSLLVKVEVHYLNCVTVVEHRTPTRNYRQLRKKSMHDHRSAHFQQNVHVQPCTWKCAVS